MGPAADARLTTAAAGATASAAEECSGQGVCRVGCRCGTTAWAGGVGGAGGDTPPPLSPSPFSLFSGPGE